MVKYLCSVSARNKLYSCAGRVASAAFASGNGELIGRRLRSGAACPNGDESPSFVCDRRGRNGLTCAGIFPVVELVSVALDGGERAVGLVLVVSNDAVSAYRAAVCVENSGNKVRKLGAVIVIKEDLRLVYAALDQSGKDLAAGRAQDCKRVCKLKIGNRVAVAVFKALLYIPSQSPACVVIDPVRPKVVSKAYKRVKLILRQAQSVFFRGVVDASFKSDYILLKICIGLLERDLHALVNVRGVVTVADGPVFLARMRLVCRKP